LKRYGFMKSFETGKNLHVNMLKGFKHNADFVLKIGRDSKSTIVLEHHPDIHETRHDLNYKEKAFLDALEGVDDTELIEGLFEYYFGDLKGEPKDAATRMFLGGHFGSNEIDFYDLRRMAMIKASPLFDENTRYIRTRTVADLFDQLIWPLYYELKGILTRDEARQEFDEAVQDVQAQTQRFDATILPIIFDGDEKATSPQDSL